MVASVAVGLALSSCGGSSPDPTTAADGVDPQQAALDACLAGSPLPTGGRLAITTTVAPITSIVANVVGDLADVVGIVPEGTNSHTFEPPPSVADRKPPNTRPVSSGSRHPRPPVTASRRK